MSATEQFDKFDKAEKGAKRRARPGKDLVIDYKDPETLRPFITEAGKIVPQRVSRLSASQQRKLTQAVKRARHLALLPYVSKHGFTN